MMSSMLVAFFEMIYTRAILNYNSHEIRLISLFINLSETNVFPIPVPMETENSLHRTGVSSGAHLLRISGGIQSGSI